jgi:hypothetical protein
MSHPIGSDDRPTGAAVCLEYHVVKESFMDLEFIFRLAGLSLIILAVISFSLRMKKRFVRYRTGSKRKSASSPVGDHLLDQKAARAEHVRRLSRHKTVGAAHMLMVEGLALTIIGHAFSIPGPLPIPDGPGC